MSSLNGLDLVMKFLPVLIPIILIELGLMVAALIHVLKRKKAKYMPYGIWIAIIVCFQIVGPVLYFIIGREDA
jgi:hypothetical protein